MNDFATDRDLLNLNYLSDDCTDCTKSNLQLAQKAPSYFSKSIGNTLSFFVPDISHVMTRCSKVFKSVHGSKKGDDTFNNSAAAAGFEDAVTGFYVYVTLGLAERVEIFFQMRESKFTRQVTAHCLEI